jgi:hypothetical protein
VHTAEILRPGRSGERAGQQRYRGRSRICFHGAPSLMSNKQSAQPSWDGERHCES